MASSFLSPEAQAAALLGICFILHVPKRRFVSAIPHVSGAVTKLAVEEGLGAEVGSRGSRAPGQCRPFAWDRGGCQWANHSSCPCRPLLASSQPSLTQSWPPGSSLVVKGLTGDLEGEGTGLCLAACQTLFRTYAEGQ